MKILIIGAGPAGLSFAALTAATDRSHNITVLERNAANQSPGWGVTLRDHALDFLGLKELLAFQMLEGRAFRYRGELIVDLAYPKGVALATVSRTDLLRALTDCCLDSGVEMRFGIDAASIPDSELARYDLVVASDGAHSDLRRRGAEIFKPSVIFGQNRYAWLGVGFAFRKLTILLQDQGIPLMAWAYQYTNDRSTFIVECTEETWKSNFSGRGQEKASMMIAKTFQAELSGQSILPGNPTQWQRYQVISCARLRHRNIVLVGDAAHTTHFSQGFGTMFAFDDALTLHTALKGSVSIAQALATYEMLQCPKIEEFQMSSSMSMRWGETLLGAAAAGDERGVRELIAARWANNQVPASPLRLAGSAPAGAAGASLVGPKA